MALTMFDYIARRQALADKRYAPYDGHRIPCASGRVAYHLKPASADLCCGPDMRIVRELTRVPERWANVPWVQIDA